MAHQWLWVVGMLAASAASKLQLPNTTTETSQDFQDFQDQSGMVFGDAISAEARQKGLAIDFLVLALKKFERPTQM